MSPVDRDLLYVQHIDNELSRLKETIRVMRQEIENA